MNVLIIPSAKLTLEELQIQFGEIPPLLVPINGKTVFDILYKKYQNTTGKIYGIAYGNKYMVDKYIKEKNLKVETIELDRNAFLFLNTDDLKRWSVFEHSAGKILNILDKKQVDNKEKFDSSIGYFNFTNVQQLKEVLEISLKSKRRYDYDDFYNAIKLYNEKYSYSIIYTDKWNDLGHLNEYLKSKKTVKARYFNTINIDTVRGILTKKSDEKEKFINEIKWYLKLPDDIQYLAPRIFNYSLSYEKPYVSMEYYGYSTIHDMYVYGNYDINQWEKTFNSIKIAINDMKKYKLEDSNNEIRHSLEEMYLNKTLNRLQNLRENADFKEFFNNRIIVNGHQYLSLDEYMEMLPELLCKFNIYDIEYFSIIHGDLCFTNMLYDIKSDVIRLVDPRGKFGSYDIYGDVRYDLAKLSHSIEGKYDFIIEDLFNINVDRNVVKYEIFYDNRHREIETLYKKFLSSMVKNVRAVQFIEALLFLSMVPLHKDYLKRQYLMLVIGVQTLQKLIDEGVS